MSSPGVYMLLQRVTLTPFVREVGLFAQPSLDTNSVRTLRARVEKISKRIRRPGGDEVLASSKALIYSPSHVVSERDKIELPDGTIPPIIEVTAEPDQRGKTRMYRVIFGNSRRTG